MFLRDSPPSAVQCGGESTKVHNSDELLLWFLVEPVDLQMGRGLVNIEIEKGVDVEGAQVWICLMGRLVAFEAAGKLKGGNNSCVARFECSIEGRQQAPGNRNTVNGQLMILNITVRETNVK